MSTTMILGLIYGISEMGLSLFKRAGRNASGADQGSLKLLWVVILLSIAASVIIAAKLPSFEWTQSRAVLQVGTIIFAFGLALRWWAIVYLGRFFTVNVAIVTDHRVVDSGPYRLIRHPSYAGALLAFFGFGLRMENWLSLLVLVTPITFAFVRRIQIEESVLLGGLGQAYQNYSARTKRLIPFVY